MDGGGFQNITLSIRLHPVLLFLCVYSFFSLSPLYFCVISFFISFLLPEAMEVNISHYIKDIDSLHDGCYKMLC